MENELAVRFVQFDLFQGKKSAFLNEIPLPVKTVARSGDVNKRWHQNIAQHVFHSVIRMAARANSKSSADDVFFQKAILDILSKIQIS